MCRVDMGMVVTPTLQEDRRFETILGQSLVYAAQWQDTD